MGEPGQQTPWATVEAAYDKISANFAESRRFPWPFVVTWLQGGIDRGIDRGSGDRTLLVAGCGDGRHVQTALELGFENIFALDLSQGMLRAAEKRLGELSDLHDKVVFLHGDTRAVALPDASVHDILSCTSARLRLTQGSKAT